MVPCSFDYIIPSGGAYALKWSLNNVRRPGCDLLSSFLAGLPLAGRLGRAGHAEAVQRAAVNRPRRTCSVCAASHGLCTDPSPRRSQRSRVAP